MYQMNEYELVKLHWEGQYPFTYRGENWVLWGCFAKNILGQRYLSCGRHWSRPKVYRLSNIFHASYSNPPSLGRHRNWLIFACFPKLFQFHRVCTNPSHLSSHRDRSFFNIFFENKLFLWEMTKTATVRLTESVRTMAVLLYASSRHKSVHSTQFHLPDSECCSSGQPIPFDFPLSAVP